MERIGIYVSLSPVRLGFEFLNQLTVAGICQGMWGVEKPVAKTSGFQAIKGRWAYRKA